MKYNHNILEGKRWIWFDLDDTLYDFSASSLIALGEMYAAHRLDRFFENENQWRDIYHRHNDALWAKYSLGLVDQPTLRRDRFLLPLLEVGTPRDIAEQLTNTLDTDYLAALARTGLTRPFARELLVEARRRGYKIGILSNGFVDVQFDKIRTARLSDLIDCVVLSDEIGFNKPDRRLFEYALRRAGATAEESVLIGDNPSTDIEGALRAGWSAILYDPEERFEYDGFSVIRTLDPESIFSKK